MAMGQVWPNPNPTQLGFYVRKLNPDPVISALRPEPGVIKEYYKCIKGKK